MPATRTVRSPPSAFTRVQPALALTAASTDDLPLSVLAARTGLSPFHLHRLFSAVAGETPKQYALRLRVSRGAVLLLSDGRSVLDIALACGFGSHETFTRAFRRQFGISPRAYRSRGFVIPADTAAAAAHAATVRRVAPCIRLFHGRLDGRPIRCAMPYDVVRQELSPQPVLVVRRRVPRSEIAAAIGASLGHIFQYAQQHGLPLSGHPITRYVETGAGLLTIEPGMRIAGPQPAGAVREPGGDATVVVDMLPGGPAATTIHAGPYETLSDAYAALERWMDANGHAPAGPPWESYITDPAEHPDPADWRTEVCWPIR